MSKSRDTLQVTFFAVWILVGVLCLFALSKYLSNTLPNPQNDAAMQAAGQTPQTTGTQQEVNPQAAGQQQVPIQPNQQMQQQLPPGARQQIQGQMQPQQAQQSQPQQVQGAQTQAGPEQQGSYNLPQNGSTSSPQQ